MTLCLEARAEHPPELSHPHPMGIRGWASPVWPGVQLALVLIDLIKSVYCP